MVRLCPERYIAEPMKAVVQRVGEASVTVDGDTVGRISLGLLVLVGVAPTDSIADVTAVAEKLAGLRVFSDADDKMNKSVLDVDGEVLLVSQFTLLADVRKGRRPSFIGAAAPELAEPLVQKLADQLRGLGVPVQTGSFGNKMRVALVNDGPVTLVINSAHGKVY
jgi:D-tyrosyl-tRNA(Tyr) deacylase